MRRITAVIVIILLALVGYFLYSKQVFAPQTKVPVVTSSSSPVASASAVVASSVNYLCSAGKSVFDSLKEHSSDVQFKQYSFGKLVTSINGKEQGDNKYWLYKIDQKEASSSADVYQCKGGEQILWELK